MGRKAFIFKAEMSLPVTGHFFSENYSHHRPLKQMDPPLLCAPWALSTCLLGRLSYLLGYGF